MISQKKLKGGINDAYFRHPKEIFVCEECERKHEKIQFMRGEVDGEINRKRKK